MNKYSLFKLLVLCSLISGCASFQTPYQDFIDDMNTTIINHVTIEELSNPSYDPRSAPRKYLIDSEELKDGDFKYHYKRPNIWKRHCYYHFIVDGKTRIVKGWGFDDVNKVDPKKECGVSG